MLNQLPTSFFIRKKKSATGWNVYFNGILVSLVNEFNIQKGSQKTRERIKVEVNYSVCFGNPMALPG